MGERGGERMEEEGAMMERRMETKGKREEKPEDEHKEVGEAGEGVQEMQTGEEGKEPEERGAGKGQGGKTGPEYREGRRTGSP